MSRRTRLGPGGVPAPDIGTLADKGFSVVTPDADYLAANAVQGRIPTYFVEYDGITTRIGSHPEMGFANIVYLMARAPQNIRARVYPQEGRSSIDGVSLWYQDSADQITALIGSLYGRVGTLRMGFLYKANGDPFPETSYISRPLSVVNRITDDELLYSVTHRNVFSLINKDICEVERTTLRSELGTTNTVFILSDTSKLATNNYWRMGAEVGTFTVLDSMKVSVTRGELGTRAAAHSFGATFQECVYYEGNIVDIAKEWITGDELPKRGAGIPESLVDTASLAAIKSRLPDVTQKILIDTPQNGYDLVQRRFCQSATCYPIPNAEGQLAFQDFRQPTTAETLAALDTDNIIDVRAESSIDPETYWNSVSVKYHEDFTTGALIYESDPLIDAQSIVDHGLHHKAIEVPGLRHGSPGYEQFIAVIQSLFLNRYKNGAIRHSVELFLSEHVRAGGEIVELTHPRVPDPPNAVRGVTSKLYEIIERNTGMPDPELVNSGKVQGTIEFTGFDSVMRVSAPDDLEDWEDPGIDATELSLYAWSADDNDLLSDGAPGYIGGFG